MERSILEVSILRGLLGLEILVGCSLWLVEGLGIVENAAVGG